MSNKLIVIFFSLILALHPTFTDTPIISIKQSSYGTYRLLTSMNWIAPANTNEKIKLSVYQKINKNITYILNSDFIFQRNINFVSTDDIYRYTINNEFKINISYGFNQFYIGQQVSTKLTKNLNTNSITTQIGYRYRIRNFAVHFKYINNSDLNLNGKINHKFYSQISWRTNQINFINFYINSSINLSHSNQNTNKPLPILDSATLTFTAVIDTNKMKKKPAKI